MDNLKHKSIKGFFWNFIGKISNQGIGFIISIFLARLLSPEEFGLVGMVLVIIPITQVFIDMGFGAALIQKKEISQQLYSSVFWINIIMGGLLTFILYFSADTIAHFYQREELTTLVQILSLLFIISSFGTIQTLLFTKNLDFKTQTIIAVITSIISGGVGIFLAFHHYGVLALVYQKLLATILNVLSYWIVSKWRPLFHFSINDIKSIWGFSSKQFIDGIVSSIYANLDMILIGKMFQAATLGFYSRAKSLDSMVNMYSSGSLTSVFFPMISTIQNDTQKVIDVYKKSMLMVALIGVGLSGFLYVVANDLFIILFTEKWNYSAKLFKIMDIVGFTYPLSSIMVNLILGLGHSGKNLRLGLWKKSFGLMALLIGYFFGIEAFLFAYILVCLISLNLNMLFVQKIISIPILTQYTWIIKPLFFAIILVIGIEFGVTINNIYLSFMVRGIIFSIGFFTLIYFFDHEISSLLKNQINNLAKYVRNRNS